MREYRKHGYQPPPKRKGSRHGKTRKG
jgi:hypothetical protein